jgi:phosphoenolpyruvate synthase/pyruvate phosphate dikinase
MEEQATNPSITKMVTLEATSCWCGVAFAVETHFLKVTRSNRGEIYCPLGHRGIYGNKQEVDRLKAEIEAKESALVRQREEIEHEREKNKKMAASNHALRGVVTRTKRRVGAGVCPVFGCKRHFTNLERHVATKHPGYEKQEIG